MEILIDYLCFTSKIHDVGGLKELLGLNNIDFLVGKAFNGWSCCDYSNGIKILYGTRDDIAVNMSGSGCRFLESCNDNHFDWLGLFDYLKSEGDCMNISRLDLACDEKEGILDMKKMVHSTEHRKYISRARSKRWIAGDEECIIFGATTSDTRLRIYNKALERGVEGHWMRSEFQFRDEAADSAILNLIKFRNIGRTYGGIMNNYLRFTTKNPELCAEHYETVKTTQWWQEFVGTSEKIKNIRVGGLEYNYMNLEDFITKQCASSLKTYIEANHGDISGLMEIVDKAKINKKQKDLLSAIELEYDSRELRVC